MTSKPTHRDTRPTEFADWPKSAKQLWIDIDFSFPGLLNYTRGRQAMIAACRFQQELQDFQDDLDEYRANGGAPVVFTAKGTPYTHPGYSKVASLRTEVKKSLATCEEIFLSLRKSAPGSGKSAPTNDQRSKPRTLDEDLNDDEAVLLFGGQQSR